MAPSSISEFKKKFHSKGEAKNKLPDRKMKKYLRIFWVLVISPFVLILLIVFMVSMEWFGPLPHVEDLQNPQINLATEIISSDGKILGKSYGS